VPGLHHQAMTFGRGLLNSLVQSFMLAVPLQNVRSAELHYDHRTCIEGLAPGAELADFEFCRPAPVSTIEKQAVLASLPAEGEVTRFNWAQREKLDRVRAVLRAHARDSVYAVKVVEVRTMTTALLGRVVLLISRPTLDFLDADELGALAAHEVGHEYVWNEYEAATQARDPSRQRQLELACDRVAAETLLHLGISPSRLTRGLERVLGFNRARFGVALNESRYPRQHERAEVIRSVTQRSRLAFRGTEASSTSAAEFSDPAQPH
jgi:hypothetical protein